MKSVVKIIRTQWGNQETSHWSEMRTRDRRTCVWSVADGEVAGQAGAEGGTTESVKLGKRSSVWEKIVSDAYLTYKNQF